MTMPFDRILARDRIVEAALPHIPFDGWSLPVLARAAEEAGYPPATALRVFPNGVNDALAHWCAMSDRAMVAACEADPEFAGLKIREKIARAIRLRLAPLAPHREAVRRTLGLMALPGNLPLSMRTLWATVDAVWQLAGDRATDFNYYSKRGLAAGVYSSTLLFWLEDRSEGQADTWEFLDRRIADVMAVPRAMADAKARLGKLANPFAGLAAKFRKTG
ncbi:MAG: COQ9 family protein [Rhodospirillales bacterium]|nr:COQ9 family protein [Rhodospirillales bacterium]